MENLIFSIQIIFHFVKVSQVRINFGHRVSKLFDHPSIQMEYTAMQILEIPFSLCALDVPAKNKMIRKKTNSETNSIYCWVDENAYRWVALEMNLKNVWNGIGGFEWHFVSIFRIVPLSEQTKAEVSQMENVENVGIYRNVITIKSKYGSKIIKKKMFLQLLA